MSNKLVKKADKKKRKRKEIILYSLAIIIGITLAVLIYLKFIKLSNALVLVYEVDSTKHHLICYNEDIYEVQEYDIDNSIGNDEIKAECVYTIHYNSDNVIKKYDYVMTQQEFFDYLDELETDYYNSLSDEEKEQYINDIDNIGQEVEEELNGDIITVPLGEDNKGE